VLNLLQDKISRTLAPEPLPCGEQRGAASARPRPRPCARQGRQSLSTGAGMAPARVGATMDVSRDDAPRGAEQEEMLFCLRSEVLSAESV
jgi:hypothetical protein